MIPKAAPVKADALLLEHLDLFSWEHTNRPILDLACGDGYNGIFLAAKGFQVTLADRSDEALTKARALAQPFQDRVTFWKVDLEKPGSPILPADAFSAILVFRYLHRPLIPAIKNALIQNSLLIYETFTIEQPRFGKPHNPDFLLQPGEIKTWFADWQVIHYFEGILENPKRAVAQLICRKP